MCCPKPYGAIGSECDLAERGLIDGGFVRTPYQARVLLRLLVALGASASALASTFAELD